MTRRQNKEIIYAKQQVLLRICGSKSWTANIFTFPTGIFSLLLEFRMRSRLAKILGFESVEHI